MQGRYLCLAFFTAFIGIFFEEKSGIQKMAPPEYAA